MRPFSKLALVFVVALTMIGPIRKESLVHAGALAGTTQSQPSSSLTPLQLEIEKQRQRLSSGEVEERRDALMRLRSLEHPSAARVASSALNDPVPMVRATAAAAILALSPAESAASLLPLLSDKDEFVRQQAAYALGRTKSNSAVAALAERLTDRQDSVRAAAVVALGDIGDPTALTSLTYLLGPQSSLGQTKKSSKVKPEKNEFVLRAAAHSLGQIGNRAALPALISVLSDEKAEVDVRREAATALGQIGDSSALPALRDALTSHDPHLAAAAHDAIRKISQQRRAN